MFNFARDLTVTIAGTNRTAEVTEIHIEQRYETSAGVSPQIEIPFATIQLSTGSEIFQNQTVLITVTTQSAYRDTTRWPGAIELFYGKIDQVDEVATPFGLRLVTVTAYSPIRELMTGKIDSVSAAQHAPRSRATVALNAANSANWPPTAPATMVTQSGTTSGAQMPAQTITNTKSGDVLQSAIDAEAGAVTYASWDTSGDVFHWFPRGTYAQYVGAPPSPGQTTFFSSTHANSATHFCVTDLVITKETSNKYNSISASLEIDPTIYINGSNYAACTNNTSIGLYGSVPLDVTLNYHKLSTDNRQYLKDWVDNLNLTKPAKRVQSVSAIAFMRDGYVNGYLIDPYWFMRQNIPVTIQKIYSGTVKKNVQTLDYYFVSGQIHDITPTSWTVQYELWKGY
jgi:hypothetical protein